ncbi:unnamed protein product [marine sediment metagenome]|uniref:Uncharacterized protein n=1 Tax=marine sediment metagenome TaxID=412755 RepID=X1L1U5_9ZZZZ
MIMAESKSHKAAANRLADLYGAEYNQGKGADINTPGVVIEVETPETVSDGLRQLQGHQKPVYVAGTNKEAVEKALEKTKGTTVGVMDNQGNIVKSSTRR